MRSGSLLERACDASQWWWWRVPPPWGTGACAAPRRGARWTLRAITLLAALCHACTFTADYEGTSYRCDDGKGCPAGFACRSGRCALPDEDPSIDRADGPEAVIALDGNARDAGAAGLCDASSATCAPAACKPASCRAGRDCGVIADGCGAELDCGDCLDEQVCGTSEANVCGAPASCEGLDSDEDGVPDCRDGCPRDPGKVAPAVCGCGVSEGTADSDGDGTVDCFDGCPRDATKTAPGACGCDEPETCTEQGTVSCWGPSEYVGAAPALALTSLAGGYVHACGLRNGAVHCWGRASTVAVKPPTGVFGLIAAGDDETCAVFSRGDEVTCWRKDGTIESRMGEYVELALGQGFACGLRGSGLVDCWGAAPAGLPSEPLHGITAGMSFACGVREDGRATCWGTNKQGGSLVPPSGARFVQLAAGFRHVCGLDHTGSARCWGGNADGMAQPPAGPFTQLAAGNDHTCGLRVDGRVLCWGSIDAAPTLAFRQIVAGKDYVCGVR